MLSVGRGFIKNPNTGSCSRQCDVLAYEDFSLTPILQEEEFVIVDQHTARVVGEIKSNLTSAQLKSGLNVLNTAQGVVAPNGRLGTFILALNGVSPQQFCKVAAEFLREKDITEWPMIVAVAKPKKAYVALRQRMSSSGRHLLVMEFGAANIGAMLGIFILQYRQALVKVDLLQRDAYTTDCKPLRAWKISEKGDITQRRLQA
jgi:hypothetical protein